MKAILPVAGKGTRLRPHTHTRAKSLVTVAGKAVLGHILDRLRPLPIEQLIFIVDENGQQIQEYVEAHYNFVCRYAVQAERRGPAHAVSLASEFVQDDDPVLIVFNDCICNADLSDLDALDADGAIWVHRVEDPRRFGVVLLEDGRITQLYEKSDDFISDLAMVGLYYLRSAGDLFRAIAETMRLGLTVKGEYYLPQAFELMIQRGARLIAPHVGAWLDCGRPETLLETNRYLLDHGCAQVAQTADSVILPPVHIAPGVEIVRSIVGPYVSIDVGARIRDAIVRDTIISANAVVDTMILDRSLIGEGAVLEGGARCVNVGDSSQISYRG